jgi:benzoyl-CoA reductase/2-hydroxyglutaryl-CoA dehydratase subunit BcrC/BadD/HgdB
MGEAQVEAPAKAVGWFCSFVPEELILAAGLESVRLHGVADNFERADAYVSSNFCPFLKNVIDSAVSGKYDDLAGVVLANSCDGMRRVYDLWDQYAEGPPAVMLEVPKNRSEDAVAYFADCIMDLRSKLEGNLGVEISDQALRGAIQLTNENRRLVRQLFEGQKAVPARHRGSEILEVFSAASSESKQQTAARLKGLIGTSAAPAGDPEEPRILVLGNRLEPGTLLEMVETAGGAAVVFDTCNGLLHYEDLVDETLDPAEALARRYLLKPSCARMPGVETRRERLAGLIQEYGIQGVIHHSLKFCDYSLFESPQLGDFLQGLGVPLLVLETDYVWGDSARLQTRVEAFLELVGTLPVEEGGAS